MFGLFGGKDDVVKRVGAKEKIMKARMIKKGGFTDHIKSKGEGKEDHGVTVTLIYILSCALAYVLQIGVMAHNSLPFHTGMNGFDNLMFGAGVPPVTGNELQDTIIVPMLRGLVIFLVAGFLPLTTLLWIRAIDKPHANPFVSFWGVTVGVFLVFFFCKDFFFPLLGQVADVASPG